MKLDDCVCAVSLFIYVESAVVWKNPGEDLTVQCRAKRDVGSLSLKKGLNEEVQIFYKDQKSDKNNIDNDFKNRLQLNGQFPNMDFLIKNLSSADTGLYWCVYGWFDQDEEMVKNEKGQGSVLLVVKGKSHLLIYYLRIDSATKTIEFTKEPCHYSIGHTFFSSPTELQY